MQISGIKRYFKWFCYFYLTHNSVLDYCMVQHFVYLDNFEVDTDLQDSLESGSLVLIEGSLDLWLAVVGIRAVVESLVAVNEEKKYFICWNSHLLACSICHLAYRIAATTWILWLTISGIWWLLTIIWWLLTIIWWLLTIIRWRILIEKNIHMICWS